MNGNRPSTELMTKAKVLAERLEGVIRENRDPACAIVEAPPANAKKIDMLKRDMSARN